MGAQKSIHVGQAKIDFNVDLTHKLCAACLPPPFRNSGSPFSQIIGRLCIKHPCLFGRSEKLDLLWDKGLQDSNLLIAFRRPRPEWFAQQSFVIQHSITPEIGVHGLAVDNFSRSGSRGINLSRLSAGVDLNEPATTNWNSTMSIRFEHVRPITDEGRPISRDLDGFPLTCSGNTYDNMVVLKQESQYAVAGDNSFSRGVKLGPAFLVTSLTGGSIVGDMAPYQAFTIGGLDSVRGYGEGAIGSGRSCLVANGEITLPMMKRLEGAIFMDCGTDLGSAHHVPGYPALRQGKPGFGLGLGYGLRFNSKLGQLRVDYAINAFQRKTVYFGINNVSS